MNRPVDMDEIHALESAFQYRTPNVDGYSIASPVKAHVTMVNMVAGGLYAIARPTIAKTITIMCPTE